MKRITTPHAAPQSSSLLRTLSLALLGLSFTPGQVALAQGKGIVPSREMKKFDPRGPVIMRSIFSYPTNASSVSEFFKLLQTDAQLQPKGKPKKSGQTSTGTTENSRQNGAAGPLLCSVEKYNLASSPPEYAAGNFDQDKLWVGGLLQSDGLERGLGSLQALSIPSSKRRNIKLTSALPVVQGSATIAPSQSSYNETLARMRQAAASQRLGTTVRYEFAEESSFESSALKLGLDASYLTARVSGSLGLKDQSSSHKITAVFIQNAFTVNADLEGQAPGMALFGPKIIKTKERRLGTDPGVSVNDLETLGWNRELSYRNPPTYVDSISYGRMLFVTMQSDYSASEMEAALRASYSAPGAGVSASLDYNQQKVLSSSKFSVYASGGDEARVISLIRTGKLEDYFQGETSPTTFVPISFTSRHMGDNSHAAYLRSGEFAVTKCNAASLTVRPRILYRSIVPDDSKYDDLYGEVAINGTRLWTRAANQHVDLFIGTTRALFPDDRGAVGDTDYSITIPFDEDASAQLNVRLMDYDSTSRDDVIGSWNQAIDLRSVVDEFRNNSQLSLVTRTIRKKGGDDALGDLIIEFRK